MRVLVTGAGGFLGQHVVANVAQRGHNVRAAIRPASPVPLWPENVQTLFADLRIPNGIKSALAHIDAVIHLAAATSGSEDMQFSSTVVGTENLLNAIAKSSVKRIIHVSSLVVYDWSTVRGVMDEKTPLHSDLYEMGGYTIAKVWQERIVRRAASAHSWQLTVLRPGFIWGPRKAEIAGMGRRRGRIHVLIAPFARLPLCHVVNCADCIGAALERPEAIGETFNVTDGDDIRVWRYARDHARGTGCRVLFLPVPYRFGYAIARFALFASRSIFGQKGKLPSLLVPRRFESPI